MTGLTGLWLFGQSVVENPDFSTRVFGRGRESPGSRLLAALLVIIPAIATGEAPDYPPFSRVVPATGGDPAPLMDYIEQPPLGLPAMAIPQRNPLTADKIALGRKLFFDRRLSFNGTLSCGMCHVPEQGFTQRELRTPVGLEGRFVKRNAPALYNVGYRTALFHDGRETTLENQVWQPLLLHNEMANPSIGFVLSTIAGAGDYRGLFEAAFEQGLTVETVGMALASYQRGLVSADSPFDRWYFGSQDTLTEAARRGWGIFRDAGCIGCHTVEEDHAHFTDDRFYDTGVGYARSMGTGSAQAPVRLAPGVSVVPTVSFETASANDLGRYEATGRSEDRWLYRVPGLRNVALTAPYMHDGSFPDLDSVIDWYNGGGESHPGLDPRIRPLGLDAKQVSDLIAFLESLTGSNVEVLAADGRSAGIGDR
jgi:cytochrome c peroxidase